MYNFTGVQAANSTLGIIQAINLDWSNGIIGILILVVVGVVAFINLSYYGTKETFLFSAFYVSIMAGLLWLSGIIHMYVLVFCMVLLFAAVLMSILTGDK